MLVKDTYLKFDKLKLLSTCISMKTLKIWHHFCSFKANVGNLNTSFWNVKSWSSNIFVISLCKFGNICDFQHLWLANVGIMEIQVIFFFNNILFCSLIVTWSFLIHTKWTKGSWLLIRARKKLEFKWRKASPYMTYIFILSW